VGGVFLAKGILLMIYGRFGGEPGYGWGAILGGFLDIIAGLLLAALFYNIYFFLFPVVGVLMIIKGVVGFVKSVV